MQKYTIPQLTAIRATRPTVRPTAPAVSRPFFLLAEVTLFEPVATTGVTVTVLTTPVMVSRVVKGVAIVEEVPVDVAPVIEVGAEDEPVVCYMKLSQHGTW